MPEEGRHYVTVFLAAAVPAGAEPRTMEPDKCEVPRARGGGGQVARGLVQRGRRG